MKHLVEAHGIGAEFIKVIGVIAQAHGHGAHHLLGELHDAIQIVHAGLLERLTERLGPDVGAVGELLGFHLWVI